MAVTQAEIDALTKAIASGARSVQVGSERIEYQSLNDMRAALVAMKRELATGSSAPTIGVFYPTTGRGL